MTHGDRRREAHEEGPPVETARIGIDNPGAFGEDQPLTAEMILKDLAQAMGSFPGRGPWTLTHASTTRLEFESPNPR